MPYIKKVWEYADIIEIEKCHTRKYGGTRNKKEKPTQEEIKKQNDRNRKKKLYRKIAANFESGKDLYLTLTYRKEDRPDKKGAEEDMKKLLAFLRRKYKKEEKELKYIWVLEVGAKGAVHLHMILNRIQGTMEWMTEGWGKGRVFSEILWPDQNFEKLSEYIVKQEREKNEQAYHCSRNLVTPQPRIEHMKAKDWRKVPEPPQGYWIRKDSVYENVDAYGYRVQYYKCVRINRNRRDMQSEDDWILPRERGKHAGDIEGKHKNLS